jgi:competence protein ComGC
MTGLVAVIMVFSIPIIAIVTNHFQTQSKIKHKTIKAELELEKLKHENYLIETEKMKLELEHMKLLDSNDKSRLM